jgi:hypothetical protein
VNTNNHARKLRKALTPKQYTAGPWQWGYVEAVHPALTTTLSANALAGAQSISVPVSIPPNSLVQVGQGGPVLTLGVSGSGPFTVTTVRGIPFAATSGVKVRVIPTVDLYLDGWQNPPDNLPTGVAKTITPGVRCLASYSPVVGHVTLVARGTGLGRSDRIAIGPPTTTPGANLIGNPSGRIYQTSQTVLGNGVVGPLGSMTEDFVSGGVIFRAAGNSLVVPVDGAYRCSCSIIWQNSGAPPAAGAYKVLIFRNGSEVREWNVSSNTGSYPQPAGSDLIFLDAGDVITLWGAQSSGASQGTFANAAWTFLSCDLSAR